jgi:hypothetical protein
MAGFFDEDFIKNSIDYILIAALLIITVYYIYVTIIANRESSSALSPPPYDDEPSSSQNSQLRSVENVSETSGITNAGFDPYVDNALRHYCIKSASNAAYTGGYMNLDMIKYLLGRGCRFLDFEVYMKNGIPIVAYSTNKYDLENYTSNPPAVSLAGVFSTIMSNAFTDTSPNPSDPLFIHLRIKSHDATAFSTIAKTVKSGLGQKLFSESDGSAVNVNLDTQLHTMLGKVILMVDKLSSPGYANVSPSVSQDVDYVSLADLVNITTNTQNVRTYQQKDLTFQPINPPDPSVYLFRIVYPDLGFFENPYNSDSKYLIKNYGTQVIAQAFYIRDNNLNDYEELFKRKKSAFVKIDSIFSSFYN